MSEIHTPGPERPPSAPGEPGAGPPPDLHAPAVGRPLASPALIAPAVAMGAGHELGDNLVYALGQVAYDLPSRSRRASLKQRMSDAADPEDAASMLAHLDENPYDSAAVQWTLTLQGTPLYFIEPTGAFAREAYGQLRSFLREQLDEGVERISLAGMILGTAMHRSGVELPVVSPALAGMYSWTTDALVSSLLEATREGAKKRDRNDVKVAVANFLERVYYELRNLGREPHERAINFAATNALQAQQIFESAVAESAELDAIEVEPSTICPPGGNCWDVKLMFFYPERTPQAPRKVYRYTVDVADVVPVTLGPMRSWSIR